MKKNKLIIIGTIAAMVVLLGMVGTRIGTMKTGDTECMYQASTLQALMRGYYDTVITVNDLEQLGDTGIGTFDNVNGEMIVLDGKVYQALNSGKVEEADPKTGVPFATVTTFESDIDDSFSGIVGIDALKTSLNSQIKGKENTICVVKITGSFENIRYRSENPAPEDMQVSLADWLEDNQVEWTEPSGTGTIVGVYFPDYLDGINTPGWHLHFISDDFSYGGHLLDIDTDNAKAQFDITSNYKIMLPDTADFQNLNLSESQEKDISKVEG